MPSFHIALVGNEPVAVLSCLKLLKPETDHIIYICSQQTQSVAQKITGKFPEYKGQIRTVDPVELPKIYKSLDEIDKIVGPDSDLTVNLVGGTKHWAIAFYDYFSKRESTRFFLGDQNNRIWNLKEKEFYKVDVQMNEIFKLHGYTPIKTDFREYTPDDDMVASQLEVLWKDKRHHSAFVDLSSKLDSGKTHKGYSFSTEGDNLAKFTTPSGETLEFRSEHAVSLVTNTGWFEYKVAKLISGWPGVQTVWMNCRFKTEISKTTGNSTTKSEVDLNEVDVIAYNGQKMLFVECKTSISKPTDIDKFTTVVKNFGGLASKALFVTEQKQFGDRRVKMKINNLLYFSFSDPKVSDNPAGHLYEMLDKEMLVINKK